MDTLEALRLCCIDGLHKIGSEPGVDGRAIDDLVTRENSFGDLRYERTREGLRRESRFRKPPMLLLLECSLWRISEADRHSVVGVHQDDRDREINEFALLEDRPRALVRFIRHTGLSNARHCF